jgi:hypothetical protein
MDEVFPILAGIVVGLATHGVRLVWLRFFLLVFFGLGFGILASWITGELMISWTYALIDIAQVIGASVMTAAGIRVWQRRRTLRMARRS